jgi:hypothetical protein
MLIATKQTGIFCCCCPCSLFQSHSDCQRVNTTLFNRQEPYCSYIQNMPRGEGLATYCWVLSCLLRPSLEVYILMENWYGLGSNILIPVRILVHLEYN